VRHGINVSIRRSEDDDAISLADRNPDPNPDQAIGGFIFPGIPVLGATEGQVLAPAPDCRQSSLGQAIKTARPAR